MERKVTQAKKKQIAGRQRFCCSANVEGYNCPLDKKPFDESGYEIDHIVELCNGGSNEDSNLQALCIMCHRVKTSRSSISKVKVNPTPKRKSKKDDLKLNYDWQTSFVKNYKGPTLSDLDSDDD